MTSTRPLPELLPSVDPPDGTIVINERCRIRERGGYRVVTVSGLPLSHFAHGDRMAEALAMVGLVEQGWALQTEVAAAFGCDVRTVRRNQRRFEEGGLMALGRPRGCPKGTTRVAPSRAERVRQWKAAGESNREIARRLGISETAVRKLLRRLGYKPQRSSQLPLGLAVTSANPKLSGAGCAQPQQGPESSSSGANPKLSGSTDGGPAADLIPVSLDTDPEDRSLDRLLACRGLLDDAAPLFGSSTDVPGAGVLLAVPALLDSGVLDIAGDLYGGIGPAFYGLRTTLVTLLLMALLRIKRPEGLKEHSPRMLGRILGLDRAPEVKTLRRKLARLADSGLAAAFGHALAKRRVETRGHAMGFLYVDGHVRAYHGKRQLPKGHLARMRISMPATTDYWVNDAEGDPLFVVTTEANEGLATMLPVVLDEVRSLVRDRRVTVVFDRGGWSPKLFRMLIQSGFDILTYRKGRCRPVPASRFSWHGEILDGRELRYRLADTGIYLSYGTGKTRRRLHLRQVTRLSDDGHQTPIVTSRRDLSAVEVAYRMFERWRQENFFKYLREEYALDVLVDYGVEPADETREVPNPRRKEINADLRGAYAELSNLAAEYGVEAITNLESARRTMRGFKIANASLGRRIHRAMDRISRLERKRKSIPTRVPVKDLTEGEVIKLRVERKHLTDLLKMVAYQAESDLVRLVAPHYRRAEDEGRTLIQSALASAGDIVQDGGEIRVALEPLSSPHRTHALTALCEQLNRTPARFPGTRLRLHFEVKPPPGICSAFPGSRDGRPDISTGG